MKKIPKLYTKNNKGRYEEYKIPELDVSKSLYCKINGNYRPVSMNFQNELQEGVWVVTRPVLAQNISVELTFVNASILIRLQISNVSLFPKWDT